MESLSTRRFFSSEFIIKHKLSFSTVIILQDIYFWLFSETPPKKIKLNNTTFYFISQSHFARFNYGLLNQQRINSIFKELKSIGIIDSSFVHNYMENYISFNWDIIKESLMSKEDLLNMETNEWWKKIHAFADEQIRLKNEGNQSTVWDKDYEIVTKNGRNFLVKKNKKETNKNTYNNSEVKEALFNVNENAPSYSKEAYAITVRIIQKSKNNGCEYFSHKYNDYGNEQSKLFNKSCKFVQAIYDGNFLNSRMFTLSEKFMTNKQFPINLSEVKEKLDEVKNDWKAVKNLLFKSFENFRIMHDDNYCPCEKRYLTKTLSDWFYGLSDEAGKYQSQFIQCLFEIPLTKKFYSEKKADKIFEGLSNKSCEYGEKLIDLNPTMNAGSAWENIKKLIEWAKLLLTSDTNAGYWISSPSEIILKFVEWAKLKNIQVSVNSFDIKWCVENNGPWVWFVQTAIKEYKLNSQLVNLVDESDFLDCYEPVCTVSFDDMKEVVF